MTTIEKIHAMEKNLLDLQGELFLLKRIHELEQFKKHMNDTFNELMGDDCTNESCNKFYNMDFTITWNGKTVTIANGADAFQEIEYTISRELEELA